MKRFVIHTCRTISQVGLLASSLLCLTLVPQFACAQGIGGGGGGFGGYGSSNTGSNFSNDGQSFNLRSDNAFARENGYVENRAVVIQGTAVLRVKPEKIRVVMAVMSEADTSNECQRKNEQMVKAVLDSWRRMGIDNQSVVEDFQAMLPRYKWNYEKRFVDPKTSGDENKDEDEGRDVMVMELSGYRIQTNLHLSVPTEPEAMKAINLAFTHGVNDIIFFEYWSSKTDAVKKEALQTAIKAAKDKADLMLMVFDKKPKLINIGEDTSVIQPNRQYATFVNSLNDEFNRNHWSGIPTIRASPPKQSFYKGVESSVDVQPGGLHMDPSIVVTSRVELQYQSPAETDDDKSQK